MKDEEVSVKMSRFVYHLCQNNSKQKSQFFFGSMFLCISKLKSPVRIMSLMPVSTARWIEFSIVDR